MTATSSPAGFAIVVLLMLARSEASSVISHVVPVRRSTIQLSIPPQVRRVYASGICIDQDCSVIATPYHTQLMAGKANLGIIGSHTDKVLSLANSSDTMQADVPTEKGDLHYSIAHDISFIYTRKPVSHKFGATYSYRAFAGEKVTVAGYWNGKFEEQPARLLGVNVRLAMGNAVVDENLILDIHLNPGQSGSAVLDDRGNLLGMIILTGKLKFPGHDMTASVALSTSTIGRALRTLDGKLGNSIFPEIPELAHVTKLGAVPYEALQYREDDTPSDTSPVIPEFTAEPADVPDAVAKLRTAARTASQTMRNVIARQCLEQGTEKPICDEVSVADGQQLFREIRKDGSLGEFRESFPIQKHGLWTQTDWADSLDYIAENSWTFQGTVNGRYVFSFKSGAEDDRCYWEEYPQGVLLFGGGHPVWKGAVPCFEQILTDHDFNVLFAFTEMTPTADDCLTESVQSALYFDWETLSGLRMPVLLPIRELLAAQVRKQKKLLYTTVSWSDYRRFSVDHKISVARINP